MAGWVSGKQPSADVRSEDWRQNNPTIDAVMICYYVNSSVTYDACICISGDKMSLSLYTVVAVEPQEEYEYDLNDPNCLKFCEQHLLDWLYGGLKEGQNGARGDLHRDSDDE